MAALKEGKKDVVVGYINNEPIVLAQNGVDVKVFAVSDQVDMVANGLLTSDKLTQENPALIKAMIRALLKGIADTIKDPAEAMQITTKFVEGLKADDPIQQKVLAATIEVMKSERYGESKASAWENTQNTLLAMGQISEKMDVNSFYTNEFLP